MKYFIYNENSILITFDSKINSELVYKISSLRIKIEDDFNEYLIDAVQSINSLLIIFKRNKISTNDFLNKIKNVNPENITLKVKSKIWEIPVCYDSTTLLILKNFQNQKKYLRMRLFNYINLKYMMLFLWVSYLVLCI
jgi:inhibitor of KinA